METKECIEKIYSERKDFILIGLTGRTGSGCSTSADILSTEDFKGLKLRQPKNGDYHNSDERKYKVLYKYAEENWNGFYVLSMSDVIFSFILENEYDDMYKIITSILTDWKKPNDLKKYIEDKANEEGIQNLKELYNKCNKQLNMLLGKFDIIPKIKVLNIYKKELFKVKQKNYSSYELLKNIKTLQKIFKSVLSKYEYTHKEIDNKQAEKCTNAYAYLYQELGNRIRKSGNVKNTNFNKNEMFSLPRRANKFIKIIREHNSNVNKNKKPTLICIDAIRDPYEAHYFRDRYSAFYLMSINTEDGERKRRLSDLTKYQIENLDKTEYPKKLKGIDKFTHQNIAECIAVSDIHIYNPISNTSEKFYLTEQLLKYIMLIIHPGLVTPTHIERCMQTAFNAKLNSGCLSRQVGAVITDKNFSIKAVGWNDVPSGQVPCNLRDIDDLCINKDYQTFSKYELEDEQFNDFIKNKYQNIKLKNNNLSGRTYQYCFKDMYNDLERKKNQVHTRALHAEENAFLQISKYGGQGIEGGNLFTTASPCELCSKKAYQLGIKHIYYIDPYPGISIQHILSFDNGTDLKPQTHLFFGAVGKAYTALYSQRLSIKDELECLIDDK